MLNNNNYEDDEIVINFKKHFKQLWYWRILIFKIFSISVVFFMLITFALPKKYETTANLYINKSSDTNLSDLNPYIIASASGMPGNYSSILPSSNSLLNEIEIMKSPLVMDKVIKDNDLKYKKGPKKGKYIPASALVSNDNLSFENKKGSNIIIVSFKSSNPKLAYNIVNSIIKNYQVINEEINTKKALKDKKMLESCYLDSTLSLEEKLAKNKNNNTLPASTMQNLATISILKEHEQSLTNTMKSIQGQIMEGQKSQIEIDQEVEKLNLIKSKLEWVNLVAKMSQDSTNVIVLKQPELKHKSENSEPSFFLNTIIGIVFGFILSLAGVIFKEFTDKKLTYHTLGEKVFYNKKEAEMLKMIITYEVKETFALINFSKKDIFGNKFSNLSKTNVNDTEAMLKAIKTADNIVLMAEVGKTDQKKYRQIKEICQEFQKEIFREILV